MARTRARLLARSRSWRMRLNRTRRSSQNSGGSCDWRCEGEAGSPPLLSRLSLLLLVDAPLSSVLLHGIQLVRLLLLLRSRRGAAVAAAAAAGCGECARSCCCGRRHLSFAADPKWETPLPMHGNNIVSVCISSIYCINQLAYRSKSPFFSSLVWVYGCRYDPISILKVL
jgi:hypothetical protein